MIARTDASRDSVCDSLACVVERTTILDVSFCDEEASKRCIGDGEGNNSRGSMHCSTLSASGSAVVPALQLSPHCPATSYALENQSGIESDQRRTNASRNSVRDSLACGAELATVFDIRICCSSLVRIMRRRL